MHIVLLIVIVIASAIIAYRKGKIKQMLYIIGCIAIFIALLRFGFPALAIMLGVLASIIALIDRITRIAPILLYAHQWWKKRRPHRHTDLSLSEAYEILGLDENATANEIKAAYHKLMKQHHPDHDGSKYFASKLNSAKDMLLKKHGKH
jgi:hypothetical protein